MSNVICVCIYKVFKKLIIKLLIKKIYYKVFKIFSATNINKEYNKLIRILAKLNI